jgi:outer membrane protein assembly factor BamB
MLTLLAILLAAQNDWPQWRGPDANGGVGGGPWPEKWTAPSWKAKLPGKGGSTPIVVGERIYLTAPQDGQNAVLCYDFAGELKWTSTLGPLSAFKHKTLGSSCNASLATDGKKLFAYFRSGRLSTIDLEGVPGPALDLEARYGPEKYFWDTGSSPVAVGKRVVMARLHGGKSWLLAIDAASGAVAWEQERTLKVPVENDHGYATPVLVQHEGKPVLLIWGADRLSAHDAADGAELWSCGGFNPEGTGYWPAIATPVVVGDLVVVPVGRDDRAGQARLHGIRLGGKGDVTATHRAWVRNDLGVFVCSPAAWQGKVYLLRHRGEVVCVDPADGKTVWAQALPKSAASYYASPVIAGGILYAAREDGVVFTARVGERFELLGEHPMGERIVASPVAAKGRLLLRGDAHLFCISPLTK